MRTCDHPACDHHGHRVYARRVLSDGTTHICVQCIRCLEVVKLPEHDSRPFIRLDEVPQGKAVHNFIEPESLV